MSCLADRAKLCVLRNVTWIDTSGFREPLMSSVVDLSSLSPAILKCGYLA
jgi:hypothetical protein